jgi:hypothetical protein
LPWHGNVHDASRLLAPQANVTESDDLNIGRALELKGQGQLLDGWAISEAQ